MVAIASDYNQEPVAADDAASAAWMDVDALDPQGAGLSNGRCSSDLLYLLSAHNFKLLAVQIVFRAQWML
jgi:hypothetical protein